MRFTPPGRHRSVAEFREHWRSVDPHMDCDLELQGADGPLGKSLELHGRTLRNRFAIHPMEGWDGTRDGAPSDLTLRRWTRFGRSGAKLIWGGEAFAVQEDGRANPHQLFRNPQQDTGANLERLLAALRSGHAACGDSSDELFTGLQLTHSGRFANPDGTAAPRLAHHHPQLDARIGDDADARLLTDSELDEIGENYVRTAVEAHAAGFDFVDLKCCHGYLLHELLGARTRDGSYGGNFAGRTRLLLRILAAVRAAAPGLEVGVRLSVADLFPFSRDQISGIGVPAGWNDELPYQYGFGVDAADPRSFDLAEPWRLLELLREAGVRLVNVTLGSPYYCPHLQRPATYPPSDGYEPPQDPLCEVARHLEVTRRCKQAFPELVIVGTGYSYLQEYLPHVAQHEVGAGHVDLVGLGRMVLSYPELPRDVLSGRDLDRKHICRTFSDCTSGPRMGMASGCYPLDEVYKGFPNAVLLREYRARKD